MDYITNHWKDWVDIIGGVVIAARIVTKLIPGDTDNVFVEKIIVFLKHLGLHIDPAGNDTKSK